MSKVLVWLLALHQSCDGDVHDDVSFTTIAAAAAVLAVATTT